MVELLSWACNGDLVNLRMLLFRLPCSLDTLLMKGRLHFIPVPYMAWVIRQSMF